MENPDPEVCLRKGIRVVLALGRFGLSIFVQYLGSVVLALIGGSFRFDFEVFRFGPKSFRKVNNSKFLG